MKNVRPLFAVEPVSRAYAARAEEYASALGNMDATHAADRDFVLRWATRCAGPIIDAGCGPGQWTDYLRAMGAEVVGVDAVPEFIAAAEDRYPKSIYQRAVLPDLPAEAGSLGGILAWYSLIHLQPELMGDMLVSLSAFLRPGGELALGFFEGPRVEAFEHAVIKAYFWPIDELSTCLREAGFEIVEIDSRSEPGTRSHGAISAPFRAIGSCPHPLCATEFRRADNEAAENPKEERHQACREVGNANGVAAVPRVCRLCDDSDLDLL